MFKTKEKKIMSAENIVYFTIWKTEAATYRITTSHIVFRKMNTACISDIDVLFNSMRYIESTLKQYGLTALFEAFDGSAGGKNLIYE